MYDQKYEIGRIGSIPVCLDGSFILLVLFFGSSWLLSGSVGTLIVGLFVVVGGIGSILVHELAHAWAGHICRIPTTHIELNGMGGLCFLERQGERREDEIFILLAGPASNLALWALFYWALWWFAYYDAFDLPDQAAAPVYQVLSALARLNLAMFLFNLAPSFPLDGGRALSAWLTKRLDLATSVEVVATLGWGVCAICVYLAFARHPMFMFLALHLFIANRSAMAVEGARRWQRRD